MLTPKLVLAGMCATAVAQEAPRQVPTPVRSLFLGDIDADGRDDAFVVQPGGIVRLLLNQGDGTFLDITERAGLAEVSGVHMALFGDADGDGLTDLYLPAWRSRSRLMLQTATGTFVDATENAGLPPNADPVDAAWKDVDGDGISDLWLATAFDDLVYRDDGRGHFEKLDLGIEPRIGDAPTTLAAARAGRGLPPLGPTGPGGGAISSAPGNPGFQPICTLFIQDQISPQVCLMAASSPTLGMLYPISSDWFVDAVTGFTGLGNTSPVEQLHVGGNARVDGTVIVTSAGAPFQVSSTALVPNLNADRLDGLDASAFATLPISSGDIANSTIRSEDIANGTISGVDIANNSITSSNIADGGVTSTDIADNTITGLDIAPDAISGAQILDASIGALDLAPGSVTTSELVDGGILDADVNANAAIQGTKIVPDFGNLIVRTTRSGYFGDPTYSGISVQGTAINGPTAGFLGSQGTSDFGGAPNADWSGQEIGVTGISIGVSTTDNFGVKGHSNGVGVRGEYSMNPTVDFGELGLSGIGVYGSGSMYAGRFDGSVLAEDSLSVGPVLQVLNHGGGTVADIRNDDPSASGTTLMVKSYGTGTAVRVENQNSSANSPTLQVLGNSMNSAHRTLEVSNPSPTSGQAAYFDLGALGSSGTTLWARNRGTGRVLYVDGAHPDIVSRVVQFEKSAWDHTPSADMLQINIRPGSWDSSQFIECERGTDIKFRVDGDGDVFSDGTYTGPADFAEMMRVSTGYESTEAGDVVCIDPDALRSVRVSREPYSRLVAGVYSTRPGFVGSEREFSGAIGPNGEREALQHADMGELYDEVPIAVVGIVPCRVSAENGPIRPGDLLVTSSTEGHAMVDNSPPVGTVIGKALESFDGKVGSTGVIRILVTLQ